MDPITMMRNALGKEEGGSGVKLEKEKYMQSVKYWEKHAIVKWLVFMHYISNLKTTMKVNEIDWILDPEDDKGGVAIANIRYFDLGKLKEDKVSGVISVFGEKDLVLPVEIHHLRILIGDHPK